jgi:S-adenosylmethionine synthetase
VDCETLIATDQVVFAAELKSKANLDVQTIERKKIGYNNSLFMHLYLT